VGAWSAQAASTPSALQSAAAAILSQPTTQALADAAADGVLDLDEAKRIALADNPSIAAAMARVDVAAAAVRESQAAYFPTVSLSASATHTEDTPLALGGGAAADPARAYALAGSTSWLVFDGFASQFRVAAARHSASASREAARDVQRLLLQGVALSYYEALLAREAMTISGRDRDFNRELSAETRKRFDAGVMSRSDVLNFDIRVAQADSSYLAAESDLFRARVALAELLGIPAANLPQGLEPAPLANGPSAALPDLEVELEYALANRPDYRQLLEARQRLEAERQAVRGGYAPRLSVAADYGWYRLDNPRFHDDRDASSSVGLVATWELFSGGATAAREARLRAQASETNQAISALLQAIVAELRQRLNAISVAGQQAILQHRIRDMTLETRDLVRSEYLAGRAGLTRLNEAQTDLVRAEGQLAQATIRHRQVSELLAGASGRNLGALNVVPTPAP
jgi:outer membrane protein TolC